MKVISNQHYMSNPLTASGDIIVGGVSGAPERLPIGSIGQVAVVTAGGLVYTTLGTAAYTAASAYEVPLTFGNGLTRTTNAVANNLITGVSGGQTVIGGTASGNNLTLQSTSHATKGKILFGTSAYDEVNNRLGIGINAPVTIHHCNLNNTDYTNTGGAGSHYLMTNPNVAGQNVISSMINNAMVAKWRTDSAGNINWVCGLSGGRHYFFTGGDYPSGKIRTVMLDDGTVYLGGDIANTTWAGASVSVIGGKVGVGATPSAVLHLKAGTAAASTAPQKFTSGALLTTPEAGAVEFLTDAWYGTKTTGTERLPFAFTPTQTDVTASRALNTTYTNSGVKSITVNATVRCAVTVAAGTAYVQGKSDASTPPTTVASGVVGIEAGLLGEDNTFQISFVVAAGKTYRIDSTATNGTATLGKWFETAY